MKTLFQSYEEEILRLYVIDGKLYSGDDKGVVSYIKCLFIQIYQWKPNFTEHCIIQSN
jgi:hypothetical protein